MNLPPQQVRLEYIRKMAIVRIVLFPLFLCLYCLNGFFSRVGLADWWFRKTFPVSKKIKKRERCSFYNIEPSASDVYICTYYKSGTNWGLQIAYQIACRGKGEFAHIHDVVPWPDAPIGAMAVAYDSPQLPQTPTGLRVIKTHNRSQYVPYNKVAKYICITRDPKSVFISSYYFVKSVVMGKLMPKVETWLNYSLSDQAMHGNWAEFTHGYWQWRNRPNVLFLSYEDMKSDLPKAVNQIAELMQVALTPAECEQVCQQSSYAYMKAIENKFYPGRVSPLSEKKGCMLRGDTEKQQNVLLSKTQRQRIDEYWQAELTALNSDFDYKQRYQSASSDSS